MKHSFTYRMLFGLLLGSLWLFCTSMAQTTIPGQTLNSNTTWTLAGSPYVVTGHVTVGSGFKLTIEAGVTIKFNSNVALFVNGALVANGTSSDSIVFTANTATPTVSYWRGIQLNNSTMGSQTAMNYCVIKYSGYDDFGNSPLSPIVLDPRINPTLTNLTMRSNRYNSIELFSGTYSQNITLDLLDKPYFTRGHLTIAAGYKMTINPGVILKFATNKALFISGALVANGKADSLITFTSMKDDSSGNIDTNGDGYSIASLLDWRGIQLNNSIMGSQTAMNLEFTPFLGHRVKPV